jgi:hypothetical protein
MLVVAALLAPTKLRADPIIVGGTPNPGMVWNSDHTQWVQAYSVSPPGWPFVNIKPTQVIQNAMNAELAAGGQAQNWPLPRQGSPFNITWTVNTDANPQNYMPVDYNTYAPDPANKAGAVIIMSTNAPAGEHWLQLVHTGPPHEWWTPS